MKIKDLLECELLVGGGGGYPEPEGDVTIQTNGTYDVKDKATAIVDVPQPSGSTNITENGTFDVTQFAQAVVNVSGGGGGVEIQTATPTSNAELIFPKSFADKNFIIYTNGLIAQKKIGAIIKNGQFKKVHYQSNYSIYLIEDYEDYVTISDNKITLPDEYGKMQFKIGNAYTIIAW